MYCPQTYHIDHSAAGDSDGCPMHLLCTVDIYRIEIVSERSRCFHVYNLGLKVTCFHPALKDSPSSIGSGTLYMHRRRDRCWAVAAWLALVGITILRDDIHASIKASVTFGPPDWLGIYDSIST